MVWHVGCVHAFPALVASCRAPAAAAASAPRPARLLRKARQHRIPPAHSNSSYLCTGAPRPHTGARVLDPTCLLA